MSKATARRSELQRFLHKLKSGKAVAIPASDVSRAELSVHISGETRPVEIDPDAWWELLNAHPPRWMSDSEFAFAEGAGCFRLMWEDRDRFFIRQLTDAETDLFCRLAAVDRNG